MLGGDAALTADWLAIRTRLLVARVLNGSSPSQAHGWALFTLGLLEEYAGSVPYAVELLAFAAERLDGVHRTRALTELAQARFRLNDVAGIGDCAARMQETVDKNDPEQRMFSNFTWASPPPSMATSPRARCYSETSSNRSPDARSVTSPSRSSSSLWPAGSSVTQASPWQWVHIS
jgi:hypothetical protein